MNDCSDFLTAVNLLPVLTGLDYPENVLVQSFFVALLRFNLT